MNTGYFSHFWIIWLLEVLSGKMCESWGPGAGSRYWPVIPSPFAVRSCYKYVTNASVTISKTNTRHSMNFQCNATNPRTPTWVAMSTERSGCDLTDPVLDSRWVVMWLAAVALHGNESIWLQPPPCLNFQDTGPRSLTQGGPHWSTFNTSVFEPKWISEKHDSMKQLRA